MNPLQGIMNWWWNQNKLEKILFICLIIIFLLIILIPKVLATPITLTDLNFTTTSNWCENISYEVEIMPLDINGTFVLINEANISMSEVKVIWGSVYYEGNKIITSGLIEPNTNNPQTTNLSILVGQEGKTIQKIQEIQIIEKGCNKLNAEDWIIKIEKWIDKHIQSVLIIFYIILIIAAILILFRKRD
ncbi:hypothetical protein CL617_04845 [archaeon]|nr:hypothetical protein [archaeon]|tara:strand:- start:3005 stop:3571 length:567 start_codon:yes stop_codon:yes gene_type:complete